MKPKMKQSMKQKVERGIALFLALVLAFTGMSSELVSASTASAKTMKLNTYQGKVTVQNAKGSSRKTTKGMRLLKGDKVATAAKSNAYIELDSTKAVKMDENTKVQLFQSGKDLELVAQSGNLFFNVKKPLGAKESLRVRSSTLIAGVRGTSAFLTVEKNKTSIFLLEGTLKVSKLASNKKETAVGTITGGKVVTLEKKSGKDVVTTKKFTEKDVPYYVLEEIAKDKELQKKIDKLSTLSSKKLLDVKKYLDMGISQEWAVKKAMFQGTPAMAKADISWDLQKNKSVPYKYTEIHFSESMGSMFMNRKGTLHVKNYEKSKASKDRVKVSFDIVYEYSDYTQEEVDRLDNFVTSALEKDDHCAEMVESIYIVDHQMGVIPLEALNIHFIFEEPVCTLKDYQTSAGKERRIFSTVSRRVSIEYPKDYKDLCLVTGGYKVSEVKGEDGASVSSWLHENFLSLTDKEYGHAMRIQ